MFDGAAEFNKDIRRWNPHNDCTFVDMFGDENTFNNSKIKEKYFFEDYPTVLDNFTQFRP